MPADSNNSGAASTPAGVDESPETPQPLNTSSKPAQPSTLADDVVASVRRMYAEDYALVERLAGLDLDDLLANATSA